MVWDLIYWSTALKSVLHGVNLWNCWFIYTQYSVYGVRLDLLIYSTKSVLHGVNLWNCWFIHLQYCVCATVWNCWLIHLHRCSSTNYNFQLVLNLSFLFKVIAKVIAARLFDHVVTYDVMDLLPSAYREGHSTETALPHLHEDIVSAVNRENKVCVSYLVGLVSGFWHSWPHHSSSLLWEYHSGWSCFEIV